MAAGLSGGGRLRHRGSPSPWWRAWRPGGLPGRTGSDAEPMGTNPSRLRAMAFSRNDPVSAAPRLSQLLFLPLLEADGSSGRLLAWLCRLGDRVAGADRRHPVPGRPPGRTEGSHSWRHLFLPTDTLVGVMDPPVDPLHITMEPIQFCEVSAELGVDFSVGVENIIKCLLVQHVGFSRRSAPSRDGRRQLRSRRC